MRDLDSTSTSFLTAQLLGHLLAEDPSDAMKALVEALASTGLSEDFSGLFTPAEYEKYVDAYRRRINMALKEASKEVRAYTRN